MKLTIYLVIGLFSQLTVASPPCREAEFYCRKYQRCISEWARPMCESNPDRVISVGTETANSAMAELPFASCSRGNGFRYEIYDIYVRPYETGIVKVTVQRIGRKTEETDYLDARLEVGPSWNEYTANFKNAESEYKITFSNFIKHSLGTLQKNNAEKYSLSCSILE